jgi:hypothetical protein
MVNLQILFVHRLITRASLILIDFWCLVYTICFEFSLLIFNTEHGTKNQTTQFI